MRVRVARSLGHKPYLARHRVAIGLPSGCHRGFPGLWRGRAHRGRGRGSGARERARAGGMFSLLYGLWKYLFSKAEFHVLILGIDKAGKTTLLEKLKTLYSDVEGLPPDRIVPTVGLNIGRVEAHKAKLIFWDLGGQSGLRVIWEKYYDEAHAVVFVVDSASKARLDDTKSALGKVIHHPDLHGAPVLVLANKQDLAEAATPEELARFLELKEQPSVQSRVQGISAHEGSGIQEGVLWLVEAMQNNQRTQQLKRHAEAAVAL